MKKLFVYVAGEPEDVDRLLWCSPPSPSSPVPNDSLSFEFEFADQSLPDVYKMPVDVTEAGDAVANKEETSVVATDTKTASDDWVLFTDVSTALSVKTADALAKLLDDENAVLAVPVDRFNERAVPRKILGRQPVVVKPSSAAAANKPSAVAEQSPKDPSIDNAKASQEIPSAATGEQILLVRYDHKLRQLLGVDAYTVS